MHEKLLIVGASGHGKVVADIAKQMSKWNSIAFLDDNEFITTSPSNKVLGRTSDALKYKDEADFFVAIGNNATREKIQEKLLCEGLSVVTLVHPRSVVCSDVEIGVGTAVMAGVVINSSSKIGKGCIINTSSSLDHDNVICDYVHVSPRVSLAGNVRVGKSTWLGIGSVVINNVNISSGCIVGAGAVVVRDICETGSFIGVPARRVQR